MTANRQSSGVSSRRAREESGHRYRKGESATAIIATRATVLPPRSTLRVLTRAFLIFYTSSASSAYLRINVTASPSLTRTLMASALAASYYHTMASKRGSSGGVKQHRAIKHSATMCYQ